ncbi:hypothetical protein, variant [Puccinia triticina 1-1 BBBD Race 1]|nr:hypothetical protein, variant [Puccinia triticina 1-1 BBBD Race 1]
MPGDYPTTEPSPNLHQLSSLSPSNRTTTSYSITSTRSHQSPTQLTHLSGSTAYQSTRSRTDSLPSQSITTNPSPNQPSFVSAKDHQDPSPSSNRFRSSSVISKTESNPHSPPTHHQHAISLLKRKKIKTHITNRQRDVDVANRQINKRIEKERRDQMIRSRDEIVAQLMDNPNDAKLVRDLGKLYLRFNEPSQNDKQSHTARRIGHASAAPRSEPSLKLAIHYLEQSIQIDNRDPLTWLFLGRAWSLLLAYPTEHESEREQRLSNSSLAFRKAIHISSNLTAPSLQTIRQTNRFRLAYAEHLEGLRQYKEAASVLQDALGTDETDVESWWELGRMMELWALDEEPQSPTTKQERVERMRHGCEAFKKATELEPDDVMLRQGCLDGEKALQKLMAELQAEEEKSLRAEEDVKLAAERMRALNLSPVTNKPATTHTSSVSALRKLVSELREIPEFGKKAQRAPSPDPTALSPAVEDQKKPEAEQPPATRTEDPICTTLVESVVSSSPAPSTAANRTRAPTTGEVDESPVTRTTPLPHAIQENLKAPEPGQPLPPISMPLPPQDPAGDADQTGTTGARLSSPEDQSAPSTQSQDDVKMMLMNIRTGSIEPPLSFVHPGDDHPSSPAAGHPGPGSPRYAYQPPSPSALPTSIMQALAARLGTPKTASSPRSVASSSSRSASNGSQKAREWHLRKTGSGSAPSGPLSPPPTCPSPSHFLARDRSDNQPTDGHPRPSENPAGSHPPSSHHDLPSDRFYPTPPHVSVLKNPPPGSGHVVLSPLSKEVTLAPGPGASPPPPDIPPRPPSLCGHPRPPYGPPPHPASSAACHQSGSPFGEFRGRPVCLSPHQDRTSLGQHVDEHIRRPSSCCLSPQPPAPHFSTHMHPLPPAIPTTTANPRVASPPVGPLQDGFAGQQEFTPSYNYALIDAHLQSILDIDIKRKQELKEIRKQIRKTDEWAESRRRSVIEELRRVCTPVNIQSNVQRTPYAGSSSLSRSISRGPRPEESSADDGQPKENESTGGGGSKQSTGHYSTGPGEPAIRKPHKSALRTSAPVGPPKRSSSTPPESSHYPHAHQHGMCQQDHAQPRHQPLVYSEEPPPLAPLHHDAAKHRALYSASVRPFHPPQLAVEQVSTELDKLGPAGFAINGITSIIQLLHQHQSQQLRQP